MLFIGDSFIREPTRSATSGGHEYVLRVSGVGNPATMTPLIGHGG
jgi:hypothetical protein